MRQPNEKFITFLLADDHSLIRQGLLFVIDDVATESKIFQAANLRQTVECVTSHHIDIAIIDAHFPDGNSLNVLPEIKTINPEIKILIFTGIDESTQALKFINAGANGFLSKMSEEDEIQNAVQKMVQHGEYLSSETQKLLLESFRNPSMANPLSRLTEREYQIAEMYAEGLGNLEIANRLEVKQNTISTIKKRLFEKLEVGNIVELIDLIKNN